MVGMNSTLIILCIAANNVGSLDCYEILSLGVIKNALTSLHQAGLTLQASK